MGRESRTGEASPAATGCALSGKPRSRSGWEHGVCAIVVNGFALWELRDTRKVFGREENLVVVAAAADFWLESDVREGTVTRGHESEPRSAAPRPCPRCVRLRPAAPSGRPDSRPLRGRFLRLHPPGAGSPPAFFFTWENVLRAFFSQCCYKMMDGHCCPERPCPVC